MTEWYEEEGTLYSYLQANKEKIWYCQLIWTWPEYIELDTPYCFKNDKDGYPWPLVARWTATRIDEEYTRIGPIDEIIEFSKHYDCWDGRIEEDGSIEGGVLICSHEGYHPESKDYPDDDPADAALYDLDFSGLYYFDRDHRGNQIRRRYDGPVMKWSDILEGD